MPNLELDNMKRLAEVKVESLTERMPQGDAGVVTSEVFFTIRDEDGTVMYSDSCSAVVSSVSDEDGSKYEGWNIAKRWRWAAKLARKHAQKKYGRG